MIAQPGDDPDVYDLLEWAVVEAKSLAGDDIYDVRVVDSVGRSLAVEDVHISVSLGSDGYQRATIVVVAEGEA